MIKQSKKEGGRVGVLWIEKSGVHPGSGLEQGRSAQQELEMGRGGRGRAGTYLFSTPVQTPSWWVRTCHSTYHFCCAPSSPGRGGAVPGISWQCVLRQSHPRHTDGLARSGSEGLRCNYRVSGSVPLRPGGLSLAAGFVLLNQSRLPEPVTAQRGFGFDPPPHSG